MDPLDPKTHQKHDLSPGIAPSGLFWTVRIPDRWVNVDSDELEDGARYQVHNLGLKDYRQLANSLPAFLPPGVSQTPPDAATASFDMHWKGNLSKVSVSDPGPNRFAIEGMLTHATMAWSCKVPSKTFKFQSAAASTSHETFAELVNERNGSFFSSEDDD